MPDPRITIYPQEVKSFAGRTRGYVVRILKEQWNHPVRYAVKDSNGNIIAAGTVNQNTPYHEFLVKPNVAFDVANVGNWPLIVTYPQ